MSAIRRSRRLAPCLVVALALAIVFAAGLLAGCGVAGSASADGTTSATAPLPTTTTGAAGTTTAGTTTTSTLTQPAVTVAQPTVTVPASELPGYKHPTIQLGDMNTPEQFVLGALYSVALRQAGYTVEVTRNIGATYIAQQALKQGSLDLYPDYLDSWDPALNSWDQDVAHLDQPFATADAAYSAGAAYAGQHGFVLLTPTPADDTIGFAVTRQFAQENHVTSLADIARAPSLTVGIPFDFDGLTRAEKAYGFKPGLVEPVPGTQYGALDSGLVQLAYVGTTDPQLSGSQYTLLADPKHVYGFGNIVPVTTPKVIAAEGPAFVQIIDSIDAVLTTRALQGLNSEVQLEGHSQTAVAEQFLQGNGLLPATQYAQAVSVPG